MQHGPVFMSVRITDFDRKWLSTAWYRHEIECELRERNLISTLFSSYNSFDEILPFIERLYMTEGFPHIPTSRCELYQCRYFLVADAIWSINFAHCAAPVQVRISQYLSLRLPIVGGWAFFVWSLKSWHLQVSVENYPNLNLPQVCPAQPQARRLFCEYHSELVASAGEPVAKKQLLELRESVSSEQLETLFSMPGTTVVPSICRFCVIILVRLRTKWHCSKYRSAGPELYLIS